MPSGCGRGASAVAPHFRPTPTHPPPTPTPFPMLGIGKRIALELAMLGAQVFIASRKLDVLEKAAAEINARVLSLMKHNSNYHHEQRSPPRPAIPFFVPHLGSAATFPWRLARQAGRLSLRAPRSRATSATPRALKSVWRPSSAAHATGTGANSLTGFAPCLLPFCLLSNLFSLLL